MTADSPHLQWVYRILITVSVQYPSRLRSLVPHLSCLIPPTNLPSLSPSPSSISSSYSSIPPSSPSKPYDEDVNSIAGVTDNELSHLSVRQLNQRLHVSIYYYYYLSLHSTYIILYIQGQDRQVVSMLKAKRRVLKNRGYALNCRMRRMQNQAQLESDNLQLRDQVHCISSFIHYSFFF